MNTKNYRPRLGDKIAYTWNTEHTSGILYGVVIQEVNPAVFICVSDYENKFLAYYGKIELVRPFEDFERNQVSLTEAIKEIVASLGGIQMDIYYVFTQQGENHWVETVDNLEKAYNKVIEWAWNIDWGDDITELPNKHSIYTLSFNEKEKLCKLILNDNPYIKIFKAGDSINLEMKHNGIWNL